MQQYWDRAIVQTTIRRLPCAGLRHKKQSNRYTYAATYAGTRHVRAKAHLVNKHALAAIWQTGVPVHYLVAVAQKDLKRYAKVTK